MNQIYAGFWRRLAALVVDCLVLAIPNYAINTALHGSATVAALLNIAIAVAYFAGLHSSKMQATVGKMAFGIKVTDLEGKRIGVPLAIGRYFAAWLSAIILCIGFVMVAFNKKRQALHDIICKTLVLDKHTDPQHIAEGNDVMDVTWPVWLVSALFFFVFVGGIVAAVALPVYQEQRLRTELTSAIAAAESVKKEVAESIATRQPLKTGPRASSSRLVQGIDVAQNGQITITLAQEALNGGKVFMAPYGRGEWRCWAEGVPAKFLPLVCREQ
jgi:uncharacterized RDD family membrane protein YckC/Tfp pilus assembly major pilin PilA